MAVTERGSWESGVRREAGAFPAPGWGRAAPPGLGRSRPAAEGPNFAKRQLLFFMPPLLSSSPPPPRATPGHFHAREAGGGRGPAANFLGERREERALSHLEGRRGARGGGCWGGRCSRRGKLRPGRVWAWGPACAFLCGGRAGPPLLAAAVGSGSSRAAGGGPGRGGRSGAAARGRRGAGEGGGAPGELLGAAPRRHRRPSSHRATLKGPRSAGPPRF